MAVLQTTVESNASAESPFLTTGHADEVEFWREYLESRPSPSDAFFDLILDYQKRQGDYRRLVAHDVGTGPGNIAARLARYFDRVVGSDPNARALSAASHIIPPDTYRRLTLVNAAAESLASGIVPAEVGIGKTDLIVVSECMPLIDQEKGLEAFHQLLHPGGVLAIYFYGRPIFVDGQHEKCNEIYERVATRACQFLGPFSGTPGMALHQRATTMMNSWFDNLAIPCQMFKSVKRFKWNSNRPLLLNGRQGYDFELGKADLRSDGEITRDVIDHQFWQGEWSTERVARCVNAMFPNAAPKAGPRYAEVEDLLRELREAMDGVRRVTFPVVLILATKI